MYIYTCLIQAVHCTVCVFSSQGIDRGVSWVSTKIGQGTELAGSLLSKVQ